MDTNETKIYNVILIASIILGAIIGYFIYTIVKNQRLNLVLHKNKLEAEITTLENERKRIAADLHDELGTVLSTVKLQINCLDTTSHTDKDIINKASNHLDNIVSRIREISNNLMPQALLRKGLQTAINEFIDNLQQVYSLQIIFLFADNIILPADSEIHLYRIMLEIIQNTIKHAMATELKIEFKKDKKNLVIIVTDNGIGFDTSGVFKNKTGLGLRNIISRVEILKGTIYLNSLQGKGTEYLIEIPD